MQKNQTNNNKKAVVEEPRNKKDTDIIENKQQNGRNPSLSVKYFKCKWIKCIH